MQRIRWKSRAILSRLASTSDCFAGQHASRPRRLYQRRIQLDLGSRQRLRDRTILLGRFCLLEKCAFIDSRHFAFGLEFNRGDLEPFANLLEADLSRGADLRWVVAGFR